jgi:hypothetical protein
MDGYDRAAGWLGALSVPGVALIGYIKRRSLRSKLENLEQKIDKKFEDLMLAIITNK